MEERSFYYRYCIIIRNIFPKFIEYFETTLKNYDFDVQSFEEDKKKYICISQTNEKRMLREAEILKIKKPKNKEVKEDEALLLDKKIIDLEKREYFLEEKYNEYIPSKEYNELYNLVYNKKKDDVDKRYGLGLFTESEMLNLEKSILEKIPIENMEEFDTLISEEFNKSSKTLLVELKMKINEKPLIEENSLFNTLLNYVIIEDYFPLHISNFFQKIQNKNNIESNIKPSLIRSYFNDEVALYFSWLSHYTKFIFVPAIFSTFIYLYTRFIITGQTAEILRICHALGMALWVQIFIVFWYRKESALKVLWDNDSKEFEDDDKRKEFVGDIKKNPITGKDELYYSEKKQMINYLYSIGWTFIFICIALFINVISLNIRGLIPEDRHKFLVIQRYWRKKSDGNSTPWSLLLGKLFALGILSSLYDQMNKTLTENENHRSKNNYYNSYIIKKFIFEAFNYFFDLFYISFALNDLKETSSTIRVYFYAGKYFRIIFYFVLPLIKNVFFMKPKEEREKEEEQKDKEDYEKRFILGEPIDQKEVIRQSQLSKYNSYNEYYPLIKEFCFLTLFASNALLGPILILINNHLNIKSQLNTYIEKTRRPEVSKKRNIGAWKYIIEFIGVMSIITNIMFCYLYNDSFGETKFSLLNFIVGEHILLIIIIAFRFFFPLTENWVKIYKLRRFFRKKEEFHIKYQKSILSEK